MLGPDGLAVVVGRLVEPELSGCSVFKIKAPFDLIS